VKNSRFSEEQIIGISKQSEAEAGVQEAVDVRARDIHFDPTPRVHLHGKGGKWRVCPLRCVRV